MAVFIEINFKKTFPLSARVLLLNIFLNLFEHDISVFAACNIIDHDRLAAAYFIEDSVNGFYFLICTLHEFIFWAVNYFDFFTCLGVLIFIRSAVKNRTRGGTADFFGSQTITPGHDIGHVFGAGCQPDKLSSRMFIRLHAVDHLFKTCRLLIGSDVQLLVDFRKILTLFACQDIVQGKNLHLTAEIHFELDFSLLIDRTGSSISVNGIVFSRNCSCRFS